MDSLPMLPSNRASSCSFIRNAGHLSTRKAKAVAMAILRVRRRRCFPNRQIKPATDADNPALDLPSVGR